MIRTVTILVVLLFLGGCASGPAPHIYVLGMPTESRAGTSSVTDAPRVRLQPVLVPDYLDSTDILTRSGQNELKASHTGRWGERLSQGLTHALATDLIVRLPQDFVTLDTASGTSSRQILVSVVAFDVWPDGHCTLAATWTVVDNEGKIIIADGRGTFIAPPAGTSGVVADVIADDAIVVASMAAAVGQLADSIAVAMQTTSP